MDWARKECTRILCKYDHSFVYFCVILLFSTADVGLKILLFFSTQFEFEYIKTKKKKKTWRLKKLCVCYVNNEITCVKFLRILFYYSLLLVLHNEQVLEFIVRFILLRRNANRTLQCVATCNTQFDYWFFLLQTFRHFSHSAYVAHIDR